MKGKSKLLALLLSAVMAFGVCATAACGDSGGENPDNTQNQDQNQDQNQNQKTPEVSSVTLKHSGKVVGETLEVSLSDKTLTLVAEVVKDDGADGKVTWTSSNEQVATVAEGTVTLKTAGETTIRAQAGNKSASVKLTVKDSAVTPPPAEPEVHSVAIKYEGEVVENTITVYLEDETAKLEAVVTKDDDADGTVAWTSSNMDVATVSNLGTLALKSVGETTVKAQAGDKSAELLVKVANKPAPPKPDPEVRSVAIKYNDANVNSTLETNFSAGSIELKAAVTADEGAEYTLSWTSSETEVATIQGDNNGATVTFVAPGETVIKAIATEEVAAQFVLTIKDDRPPVSYTITVTDGKAKNAEGEEVTSAVAGEQITLEAEIPAHKTFTDWEIDNDIELNGNTFTMPAANVNASAQFTDTLYPLTVVGGTVIKAGEVENPQGTPGEGEGVTKEMTYQFAFDTQITIKANAAESGQVFVGWDFMTLNNRVGDVGAEEYSFQMGDGETASYTSCYSAFTNKLWYANTVGDQNLYGDRGSLITNGGDDADLQGLSGYKLKILGGTKAAGETSFPNNITQANGVFDSYNGRKMCKLILKNHSDVSVSLETYADYRGIFVTSGKVTVEPNSVKVKCFEVPIGIGQSWCGVRLCEDAPASEQPIEVDMVCGIASDLYPKGDPYLSAGEGAESVTFAEEGKGSGVGYSPTILKTGSYSFCAQSGDYTFDGVKEVYYRLKITNLPAYDAENSKLVIYGRAINNMAHPGRTVGGHWRIVLSDKADNPGIVTGAAIYDFTITQYNETILFKVELDRTEEMNDLYLFILSPEWKDGSNAWALITQFTYNNVFGFEEV